MILPNHESFLKNLKFIYNSGTAKFLKVHAFFDGQSTIHFAEQTPSRFIFWHEVGHAYFQHKIQNDEKKYLLQEKQADEFARVVLS